MRAAKVLILVSLLTIFSSILFYKAYTYGYTSGSNSRADTWVVGCLMGVTIDLGYTTIHCGQVVKT